MFYMETPDLSVESPFLLILENRTTLGQHLDNILAYFRYLSENGASVHISWRRIRDFSWNRKKIAVTLHCQKETDDEIITKYKH